MTQTTKFLHQAPQNVAGQFAPVAACGRRVNRLSLTSGKTVTCPKCLAKQTTDEKAEV